MDRKRETWSLLELAMVEAGLLIFTACRDCKDAPPIAAAAVTIASTAIIANESQGYSSVEKAIISY